MLLVKMGKAQVIGRSRISKTVGAANAFLIAGIAILGPEGIHKLGSCSRAFLHWWSVFRSPLTI